MSEFSIDNSRPTLADFLFLFTHTLFNRFYFRQLQETLSREMITRVSLKEEIEHMQNTFIQRQSHDQAVIRGLQR